MDTRLSAQRPPVPHAYPFAYGRRALIHARQAKIGQASTYRDRYRESPAQAWLVLAQWSVAEGTVLHLHLAYQYGPPTAWMTPARTALRAGDLLFMRNGMLSYFDSERFAVVTAPIRYLHQLPQRSFLWRLQARLKGESPL
ncbi:hypothetical protein OHA70_11940 [Kribbella sp. NBC_00382]|uniref:hypothetical protein n=1 Tax=Kribbella sp. NBC_00382 TaxID=2975967 RepID=UPI002E1E5658